MIVVIPFVLAVPPSLDFPSLPAEYWGFVTINGEPADTTVTVRLNDVEYSIDTRYGWYIAYVAGSERDIVKFIINGKEVRQTEWKADGERIDLFVYEYQQPPDDISDDISDTGDDTDGGDDTSDDSSDTNDDSSSDDTSDDDQSSGDNGNQENNEQTNAGNANTGSSPVDNEQSNAEQSSIITNNTKQSSSNNQDNSETRKRKKSSSKKRDKDEGPAVIRIRTSVDKKTSEKAVLKTADEIQTYYIPANAAFAVPIEEKYVAVDDELYILILGFIDIIIVGVIILVFGRFLTKK